MQSSPQNVLARCRREQEPSPADHPILIIRALSPRRHLHSSGVLKSAVSQSVLCNTSSSAFPITFQTAFKTDRWGEKAIRYMQKGTMERRSTGLQRSVLSRCSYSTASRHHFNPAMRIPEEPKQPCKGSAVPKGAAPHLTQPSNDVSSH